MRGQQRHAVQTLVAKQHALRKLDNTLAAEAQQCRSAMSITFAVKTVEPGRDFPVPKVE